MIQSFAHSGDGTGWDAEIENPIAGQLHRSFDLFGACFQRGIGLSVLVLPGEIKEMLLKLAPRRFYKGLSGVGDHSFPRNPTKIQIGEGSSAQSDDGEFETAANRPVADCRGPESDDVARGRRSLRKSRACRAAQEWPTQVQGEFQAGVSKYSSVSLVTDVRTISDGRCVHRMHSATPRAFFRRTIPPDENENV